VHDPEGHRNGEVPLALEVRTRAEQADIDAENIVEVVPDASGWFPALLDVAGAAAKLDAIEALFVTTANRGVTREIRF
jgi:hypothetical protein